MDHIKTPKVENVRLLDQFNAKKSSTGTLYLTTTHLIFVDVSGKKETWVLHMHISSIEKLPITTTGCPLQIRCKTFLTVSLIIPRERDCHDIHMSLLKLSKPASVGEFYAYHYTHADASLSKGYGWSFFDLRSEYHRMGLPDGNWSLSLQNENYEICDTYPKYLYVPASASTAVMIGSSKFRSRSRLPVLSYFNSKNGAAICRCSQPLAGFSARCVEDEQMLQAIRKSNQASKFMYVVDTRPKINAMANKAAGKGYENENFYSDIKFKFLGIENIHVMRSSLQKVIEVCELKNPSSSWFLSSLDGSDWLKHIKALMDTSYFIADAVLRGISVLVHCSDGWDRTAQTCSIASLILDPFYRTIQGFQTLIEKEWLAFGHKFTDRCGLLETIDPKEISPVFTQFIECVWHMTVQFPCAFQFNDCYLLTIHDHVYSCQFGTFIGNCEKDRVDLRLSEQTYSLWGYLAKNLTNYINPLYKHGCEITQSSLKPNNSPQCFKFWKGMYNRFESGVHPRENVIGILSSLKDHSYSMEDHIKLLEKHISGLCNLLGKSAESFEYKTDGYISNESLHSLIDFHDVTNGDKQERNINIAPTDKNTSSPDKGADLSSESESMLNECEVQTSRLILDEGSSVKNDTSLVSSVGSTVPAAKQIFSELNSVSIKWKSSRKVVQCNCGSPFDSLNKKYHCWRCGILFCARCIAKHVPLPGHYHRQPVPICKACYKDKISSKAFSAIQ